MKRKFIGWKTEDKVRTFYLFWLPVRKKNTKPGINLFAELETIKNSWLPAMATHPQVFSPYKGCHRGQDIVITAAGPTLDAYKPIPGAIHIGVNRVFLNPNLRLDYLFCIDHPLLDEELLSSYRKNECHKFFGMHHHQPNSIPIHLVEKCNAQLFYFELASPRIPHKLVPYDIAHSPLLLWASVVSAAFQFALWCRPKRIFLVGCDCSTNGYFKADNSGVPQFLPTDDLKLEWQRLARFAKKLYPDTKIISINPVGLKGLFEDMDM